MPKAVVVGAGINGLCAARALVRRGWEVVVLERGPAPNPEAASYDLHRLIRMQYADPGYAARLPAAFAAWEALWRDLGRRHYVERGVLALSRAEGDWTDRGRAGAGLQTLTPEEIEARFPMIETAGVRFGLFAARGGALMADRILKDLVGWLRARGVAVWARTPVERVDLATGAVATSRGAFSGDATVLAAGVGSPRLAPDLAGDLAPRRAAVVYARPAPRWSKAWAEGPTWVDLGHEDDLWGMPPIGDVPMKLGAGRLTRGGDPDRERRATPEDGAAVLRAYAGRFRDVDGFEPIRTEINFFLRAPDERFVLRREGRTLLLSADSGHGFKFGPLTGEDVADALEPAGFEAAARRVAGLSEAA